MGDSISHFLTFLDKSGGEASGEEFVETLERVVELSGPKVEVVLSLAELYVRVGREARAAELLDQVAAEAERNGRAGIAASLRPRSQELMPAGIASAGTESSDGEESSHPETISLSAADTDEAIDPCEAADPPHLEDASGGEAPRMTSLTDEISAAFPSGSAPELGTIGQVPPEAAIGPKKAEQGKIAARSDLPENILAAEKLIAECRELGDKLATVRSLVHLGDLRIAGEDLEGAAGCFLEVLGLDPVNPTARRRLERFRQMDLPWADRITKECSSVIRNLVEMDGATVLVKEAEGAESDEWIDLTSLIEKFRDGISGQIKAEDFAGHYDLGLSHHEMGLYQEALDEFDQVLVVANLPPGVEVKTREMRAICLGRLTRHQDAIEEYQRAIRIPGRSEEQRSALRYQLACALESAGEQSEAREVLRDLAQGEEGLAEAREHLERLGG